MKEEILPLNFLRFLAALGILFVHKFAFLIEVGYIPNLFSFLTPLTSYGYLGVNLFFLISGFVITLSSEGRSVGQFISARFIRLFPVFWICVSITTLLTIFISSESIPLFQYVANLTMMPQHYGGYSFIDGSYWTLAVELRFYMFIAFILLLKSIINISLQKIALVLSLPALYLTLYFNPYSISFFDSLLLNLFYYFGSEYAQYFIAGILFYGIYKNSKSYSHYIAVAICYVAATLHALDSGYASNNPKIIVLHITLFFGLFLAISLRKITNHSLSFFGVHYRKLLITLGAITYPLYLLHSKIINLLVDTFERYEIPTYIASPLLVFSMVALILLVNSFDFYITNIWKQSSVIKGLLIKHNLLWLKKIV